MANGIVVHNCDLDYYRRMTVPRSGRALFLARFSSIKGADLAIAACKEAGVGLDLVGDTSITNEPDYYRHCASHCDGEQIRMVGPATRGGCVRWFSQAHCLIHPNMRFREPFGLAPVESLSCSTPVIAWDNGAMRETIKHGETGFLVKSQEELVAAIRSVFQRDAGTGEVLPLPQVVQDACRENALRFSVENMAKRYEQLCLEAVQTGGW